MRSLSEIEALLSESIPADVIHPPDSSRGIFGEYITAQYAMQKANEIFGIDGIADIELVHASVIELQKPNLSFGDWVIDRVIKVWVRTNEGTTLTPRIGQGVGVAQAPFNRETGSFDPIRPHQLDTALKAAMSDAIKNALMRFGQALGAELYFDERTAQALGYEVESGRVEKMAQRARANLADETCPEGGWGRDKKFGGMTLAEIYDDPDGQGAMAWAARQDSPTGFTAKMADYFALMQERGEEAAEKVRQSTTQSKAGKVVTMWYGEEKPVDGLVDWGKLVANPGFVNMIAETFNADDSIPNFHPGHPRMNNHYKRHFHVDSGRELTWNMLQALYVFCKEGSEAAAFGWPEYYAGDRAPTQQTLEKETKMTQDEPMIVIGPGGKQKVPVSLQAAAKRATDGDPDEWLWKVIGESPIEWTENHTIIMQRVIDGVASQGLDADIAHMMWEVGLGQLGQQ